MDDVRFVCDAMLGGLARWLRFAGFDTLYFADRADAEVASLAAAERRWLLSRDRALVSGAGPRAVLVHGAGLDEQVAELRTRLELRVDPARWFSRCSRCNGRITEADRSSVLTRVPPFVAASAERFRECLGCGRLYWQGSHVARIEARLRRLFPSGGAEDHG